MLKIAVRINNGLMVLVGIADTEMDFREQLNKALMSRKRLTH